MSSGCVCLTSLGSIRDLRPRRLEHRICLLGSSALKRECLLDPRQPILEAAYFGVGLETKSRLTLCRYGGEGSVGGDERWSQGRRESGGRNKEDSSLCFSCTHGIIREPTPSPLTSSFSSVVGTTSPPDRVILFSSKASFRIIALASTCSRHRARHATKAGATGCRPLRNAATACSLALPCLFTTLAIWHAWAQLDQRCSIPATR